MFALCGKLYCFFGKTMTWHLIIGYIRWQKTWLLRHDRIQFTLLSLSFIVSWMLRIVDKMRICTFYLKQSHSLTNQATRYPKSFRYSCKPKKKKKIDIIFLISFLRRKLDFFFSFLKNFNLCHLLPIIVLYH